VRVWSTYPRTPTHGPRQTYTLTHTHQECRGTVRVAQVPRSQPNVRRCWHAHAPASVLDPLASQCPSLSPAHALCVCVCMWGDTSLAASVRVSLSGQGIVCPSPQRAILCGPSDAQRNRMHGAPPPPVLAPLLLAPPPTHPPSLPPPRPTLTLQAHTLRVRERTRERKRERERDTEEEKRGQKGG
jgi:hypothetical protein